MSQDMNEILAKGAVVGVGIDPSTGEIAIMSTPELAQEQVDNMNEELLKKMSKKEMRRELQAAQHLTITLLNEIGDYQKEIAKWAQLGKEQNEFIEELSTKLNDARTTISEQAEQIQKVIDDWAKAQSLYEDASYEIKALKAQRDALTSDYAKRQDIIDTQATEICVLKDKISFLQTEIDTSRATNCLQEEKMCELMNANVDYYNDIQKLTDDLEKYKAYYHRSHLDYAAEVCKVLQLSKDKADATDAYEKKLAYLEEKVIELKKEKLQLIKDNSELEQDKFNLECEIEELNNLD